jgi:hypothetical protein
MAITIIMHPTIMYPTVISTIMYAYLLALGHHDGHEGKNYYYLSDYNVCGYNISVVCTCSLLGTMMVMKAKTTTIYPTIMYAVIIYQ